MRSPTISQPLSHVIRDVFGPSRVRRKRARLCGERSQRGRSPATRAWHDGALERICGRIRARLLGPIGVFTKSVLAARYLHHPAYRVRNRRGIQGRNVECDEDMWRHGPINRGVTRIDAVQSIAVLVCRWCGCDVYRGAGVYSRGAAPPATSNSVLENIRLSQA
jgi:hypothetical protein